MSLSIEEFMLAHKEWVEMDKRLKNLIGFNPTTSNHYGVIQLYNERIDLKTTDERIIEIRTKYLKWKEDILAIFAENQFYPNANQFDRFFNVDPMFGTLEFLGESVDINISAEVYRELISDLFILPAEWKKMDQRLKKVIGFNPSTRINHKGIRLYNEKIDLITTDEMIMEIHAKFLRWKEDILAIFAEKQFYPEAEQFDSLFDANPNSGTLFFLDEPVDINKSAEAYRKYIFNFLEGLEKS